MIQVKPGSPDPSNSANWNWTGVRNVSSCIWSIIRKIRVILPCFYLVYSGDLFKEHKEHFFFFQCLKLHIVCLEYFVRLGFIFVKTEDYYFTDVITQNINSRIPLTWWVCVQSIQTATCDSGIEKKGKIKENVNWALTIA